MLQVKIPGFGELNLEHMVMDYNGTLAVDGELLPGVPERLITLGQTLALHVVTADTFGKVKKELDPYDVVIKVLPEAQQDRAKRSYIQELGANSTVAVGNGRNDRLMLREAALGIGLILGEGAAGATIMSADAVFTSITEALDVLLHPLRLTATLRT